MNLREFRRAGHFPSLLSSFLYFDVSFMVWVLVGALANSIALDLKLDPVKDAGLKGFLVAIPLLGGSILRLVLGVMTDRLGAKTTGVIGMILTAVPLLLGWLWADSFNEMVLVGLMLGVAGASFAGALPLASRWYPPQYQGLAMGIAGAGIRMLMILYIGMAASMAGVVLLPSLPVAVVLLFIGIGMLGMGNGSVFQLVPQRFQKEIGVMTGIVGAAGGLGGFFLPNVLGSLKKLTGSFGPGYLSFALTGLVCAGALMFMRTAWERSFLCQGGKAVEGPGDLAPAVAAAGPTEGILVAPGVTN